MKNGHNSAAYRAAGLGIPVVIAVLCACSPPLDTRYEYITPVAADEDVFAYGRISPNGRFLVYSSERHNTRRPSVSRRIMHVYDVANERVVFSEPGIDGYWSPDGAQLIYLSQRYTRAVSILNIPSMEVRRNVAPTGLGDYYSWGVDDSGRDVILTIDGNFYYLIDGIASEAFGEVVACPVLGPAERPLLSKDAKLLTVFFEGTVVVRKFDDCTGAVFTNISGAKADFSWDNRYIAFHEQDWRGRTRIVVVDLDRRVAIPVTEWGSACLFPSWTRDGRLSFFCASRRYRGFVIADKFLSNPANPLPRSGPLEAMRGHADAPPVAWTRIFGAPQPNVEIAMVLVCSLWSAHCPEAVRSFERLAGEIRATGLDAAVFVATVSGGAEEGRARALLERHGPDIPMLGLDASRAWLTGAQNQIPATLVFRDGVLGEQHLGELDYEVLQELAAGSRSERRLTTSAGRPPRRR